MKYLSLFSGIGGIDFGLGRAGLTCAGQVEIDPFCSSVLERHWPDVPRHDDVRTAVAWWGERAVPDLVIGGFPCQDISSAHTNGIRRALAGPRSGLWTYFRDYVAAYRPRWAVAENVDAPERWVPVVRDDLAALGYASTAIQLFAGSFGAPHKRPRFFVVAHADGQSEPLRAVDAEVAGLRPLSGRDSRDWREPFARTVRVDDGIPARLDPYKQRRLKSLGNAVVPAVAEFLGTTIRKADHG